MITGKLIYQRNNFFIFVSIICATVFWVFESVKHYLALHELSIWEEIFIPNTHELWMRSVIVFLFLAYGILSQKLFNKFTRAEENTKLAYRELDQIFQTAADGMRLVDKNFNTIRVNKTFLDMAGLKTVDEAVGMKCFEIFKGSKCHTDDCPLTMIISGQKRVEYETEKENRGGDKTTCIVTATPFLGADNQVMGIVEDFKDVTDRRQAEKEYQKLIGDLRHSQKMEAIGTLAGGIAHDFNNILTAILGFSNFTKKDLLKWDKSTRNIDQVLKAGYRAKALIGQILTFSRKGDNKPNPLAPYLILKESLKLLRASLPSTIVIREYIETDSGLILADPTKVQQVIVNLCTNALHAMEESGGVLTVVLNKKDFSKSDLAGELNIEPGQFVELTVKDTGTGIDNDTLRRVLEPYFTTKEVGKGTGMGLAVVHGIVKEHEGFLRIESELGEGTTFRIYFPAIKGTQADTTDENSEILPTGSECILVVDDEKDIVQLHQTTLEELGYQVSGESNSLEALKTFQTNPNKFDLVLTDHTMPLMTGLSFTKKLLQIRPDIPIILCTGNTSAITKQTVMEAGATIFAIKPFEEKELAWMVRQALDGKRKDQ